MAALSGAKLLTLFLPCGIQRVPLTHLRPSKAQVINCTWTRARTASTLAGASSCVTRTLTFSLLAVQGAGRVASHGVGEDARAGDKELQRAGVDAFERLISTAVDQGIAVDVLAVGASAAASLPLLGSVAGRSGGSLALHAGEHLPVWGLTIPA